MKRSFYWKMELDFDKEIDAILRKNFRSTGTDVSTARHLDAADIAAFIEDVATQELRREQIAHLADCDRCRKILAGAVEFGAERHAPARTVAAVAVPWYRRIFRFPQLAALMGILVLVFAGFLAFSLFRNADKGTEISSTPGDSLREALPPLIEPGGNANNANGPVVTGAESRAETLNANGNAGLQVQTKPTPEPTSPASVSRASGDAPAVSADGISPAESQRPPAPAAGAAAPAATDTKDESKQATANPAQELAAGQNTITQRQQPDLPKSRNSSKLEKLKIAPDSKGRAGINAERDGFEAEARSVAGKRFRRNQGVWYDSAYTGGPTRNVRRGTSEFAKLDAGLRSIANSLGGTIVVVWEQKAYRIQ